MRLLSKFLQSRNGATSVEYAVIASLIFFAIFAGLGMIGDALNGIFGQAKDGLG